MRLTLDEARGYAPGETLSGRAAWRLDRDLETAEVRLFWYTQGKGTRDLGSVEIVRFDQPRRDDARPFRFTLPRGPYSFSGKLISLIWAVELILTPGDEAERREFVLSPSRSEILLSHEAV